MIILKEKILLLVFMLFSILFCISCGGGGGGGGGSSSNFNVAQFWCLNRDFRAVRLLSWPSGTIEKDFDINPYIPNSVAHAGNNVWVSTSDGNVGYLVKVNADTGDILDTFNVGYTLGKIIISNNILWVIDNGGGTTATRPKIIKFDLATETVSKNLEISTVNVDYEDIIISGGYLYVLIGNAFAVAKIDTQTDTEDFLVEIGESGGYGYGAFAINGTTAWIIDDYNDTIIKFDLAGGAIISRTPIDAESYGTAIFYKDHLYVSRVNIDDIVQINLSDNSLTPVTTELDPRNIYLNGDYIIVVGGIDGYGKVEDIDLSSTHVSHSNTGIYVDACEMMN